MQRQQQLRLLAVAVTVLVASIGLIQAAGPEALGVSPVVARWLGIGSGTLGVLLGFLPRVQGSPVDTALPASAPATEPVAAA